MKHITLWILMLWSLSATAVHSPYTWETNRNAITVKKEYADNPLVYLKYHQQFEFTYDDETGDLLLYQTEHQIIKVNNDNALARSNRIYIPMRDVIEITDLKARTLNPDGSVVEFDQSEIKEIKDEETGGGYQIFAVEGAQVGSEIEYYYTRKMYPDYFGREYLQGNEPILNISFKLLAPSNLSFAFKSYNGLESVEQTSKDSINIYSLNVDAIGALQEEEFSSYNGSLKRIEYKLDYNAANDTKLFRWSDAANIIYQRSYAISEDEQKAIENLVDDLKIKKSMATEERLKLVEHHIKSNYFLNENLPPEGSDITFIINNRVGSKIGLAKLLLHAFKYLEVDVQVVLTSDRSKIPFDPDFQSYNFLQEYLLYMPDLKAFVAPYSPELRFGSVPATLSATTGLFVIPPASDQASANYNIAEIPAMSAKENFDKMDIKVSFTDDNDKNNIELKRSFNGYQASFLKAAYPLIEETRRSEIMKSLVKFLANDADINSLSLNTTTFDYNNWKDPLIINSTFSSPAFIEKAGDIILFKVGELIGPQTELYQESERMTQIENDFNREYIRLISVEIPDGYQVDNLDDIIIDESVKKDDDVIYFFKSSYQVKGNSLKIEIREAYEEIYYPIDKFEPFRKVINAAADWNKIVLVLSKQ